MLSEIFEIAKIYYNALIHIIIAWVFFSGFIRIVPIPLEVLEKANHLLLLYTKPIGTVLFVGVSALMYSLIYVFFADEYMNSIVVSYLIAVVVLLAVSALGRKMFKEEVEESFEEEIERKKQSRGW